MFEVFFFALVLCVALWFVTHLAGFAVMAVIVCVIAVTGSLVYFIHLTVEILLAALTRRNIARFWAFMNGE